MAAAVVVGSLLRLPRLSDGLDHDEAYTWQAFSSRSYSTVTGHYPVPNNHILHSALVRAAAQALGHSEPVLRLPALLAGIFGIAAVWWLARGLHAATSVAALAAWGLALSPVHIGYSQVARGYTLLVLFAALAGGALLRAHRQGSDLRPWAVYAAALFGALYTQPSAALLVVALGGWSLWRASRTPDRNLMTATITAHGLVLAACAWAYGPLLDRVLAAGRQWGIDLHDGASGLTQLVWDVGVLLSGGGPLLAAAAAGAVALSRREPAWRWLFASLAAVPILIPLVHGIAPQPRGYLFLLPWVVVAAAAGIHSLAAGRARWLGGAAVYGLLALLSGFEIGSHDAQPRWRDLGRQLSERTPRGEVLVAPSLMDVEVFHYATAAIQRGVVTSLMDGQVRSLLFAVNRADGRFDLPEYQLGESSGARQTVPMESADFEVVYEDGSRAVLRLLSPGRSLMPEAWQWNAHPEKVAQIRFGSAGPAVTERTGLAVANDGRQPFRVYSQARFQPEADGLCLLLAARSEPRSSISLYAVDPRAADGEPEQIAEGQMLLTAAKPIRAVGRDQKVWYLEAFLLPVQGGGEYGVYISGTDAQVQSFADIRVFHFPWP